jgi:hypothetical protein
MRLPFALIASAATLSCAAASSADFVGFEVDRLTIGGHAVLNVYAKFTNSGDRVLNVFRSEISTDNAGGFFHSGANPFWKAGNTQNKNTSDDSWVVVGANPNGTGAAGGGGGNVVADPNFVNFDDANDSTDFSFIESVDEDNGAGWYNGSPTNTYGYAFEAGNRVLLGHFVAVDAVLGDKLNWFAKLTITRPGVGGSMEVSGEGNFDWIIPAPGALALLGVAGLASRRRRA